MILESVHLLGEGDRRFDVVIEGEAISAVRSSSSAPTRRRLALPAPANAHDHARPLSPTSFGGAAKPLETWLLRLGALPSVDPHLAALAAFGRAARGGAGVVMAHYTRFQNPASPIAEARAVAEAAAEVGVRVAFAVFLRDRNPLVYGDERSVLERLPTDAAALIEAQFCAPRSSVQEQIALVEDIARAVESPSFQVQFGPNGPQWCSDALLHAIADVSARTGRRVHMHLLETKAQRAFADAAYPEGVVERLKSLGLLSPRLTLAHCVHARPAELARIAETGATIATNPSSNLHLRSGIAPIAEALRAGCRVAVGIDSSAFDEDDDYLREMRLGHFLHGGWGFSSTISREDWFAEIVANGRRANGAPGEAKLAAGAPADVLVLDVDALDRDAVMPVAPVDLLFARATAAHISQLFVAGREIVRDRIVQTIDLPDVEAQLRAQFRSGMVGRAGFLAAWSNLEPAVGAFYQDAFGCC